MLLYLYLGAGSSPVSRPILSILLFQLQIITCRNIIKQFCTIKKLSMYDDSASTNSEKASAFMKLSQIILH